MTLLDLETGLTAPLVADRPFDGISVAFAPDGQTLLAGGLGHDSSAVLRLWDVAKGVILREFTGHADSVTSVALSPDGQLAVSGSFDKTLRLWDVATGETLWVIEGELSLGFDVAFAPDGQTVVAEADYVTARVWDVVTGEPRQVSQGHREGVYSVAFAPDGQAALSRSWDGQLLMWDVATGETLRDFTGHRGAIVDMTFAADGQTLLTISGDGTLRLWDVVTGATLRVFEGNRQSTCPFRRLHGAWVEQQARQVMWELTDREPHTRFLIRDNDKKIMETFDTVFRSEGIDVIPTPVRTPNANAFMEQWIRSAREECLDKLLIIHEAHLRRVMCEYVAFFNTVRPHQGLDQQIPVPKVSGQSNGPVRCRNVLGGIIHEYYRDAA